MNRQKFRHFAGLSIVLSHVVLVFVGFFMLAGKMEISKLIATLLILTPIFGVFAAQVVSFLIGQGADPGESTVTAFYVQVFFVLFAAHFLFITALFWTYATSVTIPSPDVLQQLVGVAESAFGFLFGMLVTHTFGAPAE